VMAGPPKLHVPVIPPFVQLVAAQLSGGLQAHFEYSNEVRIQGAPLGGQRGCRVLAAGVCTQPVLGIARPSVVTTCISLSPRVLYAGLE